MVLTENEPSGYIGLLACRCDRVSDSTSYLCAPRSPISNGDLRSTGTETIWPAEGLEYRRAKTRKG